MAAAKARRPDPARGRDARQVWRLAGRVLLALALLLAPLTGQRAASATMPVCTADGGVRHVPDPFAPAPHGHCDACLVVPAALPVPPVALRRPRPIGTVAPAEAARRPAPAPLPPEQARAPPAA
ncbi:hypothetical protein [Paracraurococcus lichenis]|uniref:DUF2946 domain-containing protein n=1 Tax=Paracraurococcus lichenis TaxID=3064888 RepID=A0ABT9DYH0_9PROT|nr:hypothetical protein [Paracraurococcus sp. LOR1-02]MDO9708795.1 hypothetical protein [Paracraurococcus sp. LOR1-02]